MNAWREACIAVGAVISSVGALIATFYLSSALNIAAAWLGMSILVYFTLVGATSSWRAGRGVLVGGLVASALSLLVAPRDYTFWLVLIQVVIWHSFYAIFMLVWARHASKSHEHLCPNCHYDMTGLPTIICPECGLPAHDDEP